MTLAFLYDCENGTNGNAVTPALSGFSVISGTTPTYTNAYAADGTLSIDFNTSSATSQCRLTLSPTLARPFVRIQGPLTALPSGNVSIIQAYKGSGATFLCEVQVTSAGKVRIRNAAFTQVAISSHTFSAGDEVRMEWDPNPGTSNNQTLRLFWGANVDGTTADETLTGGTGTAGPVEWLLFGVNSSSTSHWRLDSFAVDDTTWVGPTNPAPSGSGGTPKGWNGSAWVAGALKVTTSSAAPSIAADGYGWDGTSWQPGGSVPPPSGRFPGDPGQGHFYLDITYDNSLSGGYSGQLPTIQSTLSGFSPPQSRVLSLHRMYSGSLSVNSTELNWCFTNNLLPLVSFKATPTSVTNGSSDAALQTIANQFLSAKASNKAIWWTYYHEPEDNFTTSTAAGQYRAAVRYIKAFFDNAGCSNAAHCATLYMGGWTFSAGSGRDWRWWWPDWKGTTTNSGGHTGAWTDPNPVDFYPRGDVSSVVDILGVDSYQYDTWYWGQSLSKYSLTWEGDSLSYVRGLVAQASGTAYPICIGETGWFTKSSGSFANGQTGHNGTGWTPTTYYDSDTQAMLNNILPALLANDVVGFSYWNQYVAPPNGALGDWRDTRLRFSDPNQLRYKALAVLADASTHPPVAYVPA